MIKGKSADDTTFDIQYVQMQRNSPESSDSLYSLSTGSLPSHIRSINPNKMDVDVTMVTEQRKPSRCSSTTVYVILVAVFLISSSIAVAVAVHEIRKIQAEGRLQGFIQMHEGGRVTTVVTPPSTTSETKNVVEINSTPYTPMFSNEPTEQRTSCYKKCTMYGHPKFESNCVAGYCECRGRFYQRKSCLPSVRGCVIRKDASSRYTFLWNAPATSYSCTVNNADVITSRDKTRVYIVSVYGNHFEKSTRVRINNTRSTDDNIILALASHFPIRWELDQQNTKISKIILLSDRQLSASQVEVTSQYGVAIPEVTHLFTPVGFGDDRHSFTVEMIQAVVKNVGPITKFLGSDFADKIILDLTD